MFCLKTCRAAKKQRLCFYICDFCASLRLMTTVCKKTDRESDQTTIYQSLRGSDRRYRDGRKKIDRDKPARGNWAGSNSVRHRRECNPSPCLRQDARLRVARGCTRAVLRPT